MSDGELSPAPSTPAPSTPQKPMPGHKPIPGLPEDWHVTATEQIIGKVDMVRKKTSGPAIGIARMALFGVMAAIIALMAAVILAIGLVRLLDSYLPSSVWLPYVILGTIFVLGGLFLWSKRPKGVAS